MLFSNIFKTKKTVTINLDKNVQLTVVPVCGGVNATIVEMGEMFTRTERAFFSTIDELTRSLSLTDNAVIRKLSKAF
jgi:hypothetical protein